MASRWVVRPGDGPTVRDVVARAGGDGEAVRDGRVFVGGRRVRSEDDRVREGDEVSIAPAQIAPEVPVLARTGDLLALAKPAGIPTIADHAGEAHALSAIAARLANAKASALHATSRLDRDVSGVVVFALTKAAAARLLQARGEGRYERRYVAIASRTPTALRGSWDAAIGRAPNPRLRAAFGRDAVPAETRFAVSATVSTGAALLGVGPVTGRTHQIRVHAAHAGLPLLGDRAYGASPRITLPTGRVLEPGRIALHAARVVVPDERGEPVVVAAPVPVELTNLWAALGGEVSAWEVASSCALL